MEFDKNVSGMYSITQKLDNNDNDILSKIVNNNNIKISILIISKNSNNIETQVE